MASSFPRRGSSWLQRGPELRGEVVGVDVVEGLPAVPDSSVASEDEHLVLLRDEGRGVVASW